MTRVDKINEIMRLDNLSGEVWDESENVVAVEIKWGDHKHSHARLKYLVFNNTSEELLELDEVVSEVTETDGSDCFSAIHRFYFKGATK